MPGRQSGVTNWRKAETRRALDIIANIKPIGADGWRDVARQYGQDRPHHLVGFQSLVGHYFLFIVVLVVPFTTSLLFCSQRERTPP